MLLPPLCSIASCELPLFTGPEKGSTPRRLQSNQCGYRVLYSRVRRCEYTNPYEERHRRAGKQMLAVTREKSEQEFQRQLDNPCRLTGLRLAKTGVSHVDLFIKREIVLIKDVEELGPELKHPLFAAQRRVLE